MLLLQILTKLFREPEQLLSLQECMQYSCAILKRYHVISCDAGHVSCVTELLQEDKIDIDSQCNGGETALMFAAQNGMMIHLHIRARPVDGQRSVVTVRIAQEDSTKFWHRNATTAANAYRILSTRTVVSARLHRMLARNSLAMAFTAGHLSCVTALLKKRGKIDVNRRTKEGLTALMQAAQCGMVFGLVKHNCEWDQ